MSKKNLWQRYKEEYQKQNAQPLPVWRFRLSLLLLALVFIVSLLLVVKEPASAPYIPITLGVAFVVYSKRPKKN